MWHYCRCFVLSSTFNLCECWIRALKQALDAVWSTGTASLPLPSGSCSSWDEAAQAAKEQQEWTQWNERTAPKSWNSHAVFQPGREPTVCYTLTLSHHNEKKEHSWDQKWQTPGSRGLSAVTSIARQRKTVDDDRKHVQNHNVGLQLPWKSNL